MTRSHEDVIRATAHDDYETLLGDRPDFESVVEVHAELEEDGAAMIAAIEALGRDAAEAVYMAEWSRVSATKRQAIPLVIGQGLTAAIVTAGAQRESVAVPRALTVDDGSQLAPHLYEVLIGAYEYAVAMATHALKQAGRAPSAASVEDLRRKLFHHVMQVSAVLGAGHVSTTIAPEFAAIVTAMAELHEDDNR